MYSSDPFYNDSNRSYAGAPFPNISVAEFTADGKPAKQTPFNPKPSNIVPSPIQDGNSGSAGAYYPQGNSDLALKGTGLPSTPLSVAFFSDANMKTIQQMIKYNVKKITKGRATLKADQDFYDLLMVMSTIYLQYSYYLPGKITEQVKDLNKKVIKVIMPSVITNIKQQYMYVKTLTTPIQPIDLPFNENSKGRKSLPSMI